MNSNSAPGTAAATGRPSKIANPYPGPRPFERGEQAIFCGRKYETRELFSLLIAHQIVLLYAQSGTGKSSLINAGLSPKFLKEGFQVLPVARVRGLIPESLKLDDVSNVFVLNAELSLAEKGADITRLAKISLANYLKNIVPGNRKPGQARILILDQFEELFTFYPERWRDREDFFRQLGEALADDPFLRVLVGMREEYLGQLDALAQYLPQNLNTRYRLERLGEDDALEAIVGPLSGTGRHFAPNVAEKLAGDLLKVRITIDAKTTTEVSGEYIEPVQLQVVCRGLWEELPEEVKEITGEHLRDFGDVTEALSGFYEKSLLETVRTTGVKEGELRKWFEQVLITPAGTRGTVFRGPESTGGIPNAAVDSLENQHLVRSESRAGASWYELTHDRFIEPMLQSNRRWRRARGAGDQVRQQLEARALAWDEDKRRKQGLLNAAELAEARRWLDSPDALELGCSERLKSLVSASDQMRTMRRSRWLAGLLTAVCLITAGIIPYATYLHKRGEEYRRYSLAQRLAGLARAQSAERLDLALLLGLEANRIHPATEFRGSILAGLTANPYLTTFLQGGHNGSVRSVAFSPNGRFLASASEDDTIVLWDVETRFPLHGTLKKHSNIVYSVAFNPTGKILASGSADKTINLWDVEQGTPIKTLPAPDKVFTVAFSPDGRALASSGADGKIILWDVASGKSKCVLRGHDGSVYRVAFRPDGKLLASVGADGTTRLWDVSRCSASGAPLRGHRWEVFALAFSPDGKTLATAGQDLTIVLWDVASRHKTGSMEAHTNSIYDMVFIDDGTKLASASRDNNVVIWDVAARRREEPLLTGHKTGVQSIAGNGTTIATGGTDGVITLWDVKHRSSVGEALEEESTVNSIAFNPTNNALAASTSSAITFWDASTHRKLGKDIQLDAPSSSIAFSPDGKQLASAGTDNAVVIWDVDSRKATTSLKGHTGAVTQVAFSPDGKTLASSSAQETIFWRLPGLERVNLPQDDKEITGIAFSPDSKLFASAAIDGEITVWDVATAGKRKSLLRKESAYDEVNSLAFGPDSKLLASGNRNDIVIWNVEEGKWLCQEYEGGVNSLAFSSDANLGTLLVSGGADGSVMVWDASTCQSVAQFKEHAGAVNSVAFKAGGKQLASGSIASKKGPTLMLWDMDFDSWSARACDIANRSLTQDEWNFYLNLPQNSYHITCANSVLTQAERDTMEGRQEEARKAFALAVQSAAETKSPVINNSICWYGTIDGFVNVVWPACESAVQFAKPEMKAAISDSRGLARAMRGDTQGAIQDFTQFVEWSKDREDLADLRKKRQDWIEALSSGRNPFDQATLNGLRIE